MNAIYEFDYAILNGIQSIRCGFLDGFLTFVTHLCDAGWLWIVLAAVFLCFGRTRKMGAVIGVALIIGLLTVNLGLKPLVGRVRPYENELYAALISVREPLVSTHDASFPSGHSLAAFEGAMGVFLFNKKWGAAALALAALIAFSRLYLYVHYFTDVLVGSLLGILYAVAAYFIVNAVARKYPRLFSGSSDLVE